MADLKIRTQAALDKLLKKGLSHDYISDRLEAVSTRTVYRWAKGDTAPQNTIWVERLEELVVEHRA
jgi:hypothetical protein